MKSPLTKITAFVLTLSFVVTSTNFVLPPKRVDAQAGKAVACTVGNVMSGLAALPAYIQNTLGVSKSQIGDTVQAQLTGGSVNSNAFNSCILQPLAKIMIITIIRNIGASVVNWVNSGFEGKPSFVTDFGGTLLDAADEAVGKFIEGSELGFLCNNFSFQIRIALALKYSQPFREKARCTLTSITDNVNNFANNNGGVGWDNWLRITTEPQNNVYGAYVIADSELARRAAEAVGLKKDRITIGEGFLDFETCDEYETPAEINTRTSTSQSSTESLTFSGGTNSGFNTTLSTTNTSLSGSTVNPGTLPGSSLDINRGTNNNSFGGVTIEQPATNLNFNQTINNTNTSLSKGISSAPLCKKKSTKTPGKIISGKLQSVLGQGEIQAAVATEIDDVIAATMNQLAQKMIQGASGLLGLSQKRNTANRQSYIQQYQSQYYNANGSTNIDASATSEIEDYTVKSYTDAQNLINNDPLVVGDGGINTTTANISNNALNQSITEQNAINDISGANGPSSEQNLAIYKPTSQSSAGEGTSDKAANGVKDGAVTQYNKVAATGEEANPWWEVDLEASKEIKEVRIWQVTSKPNGAVHPADKTLETIRVVASNNQGKDVWYSSYIPTSAAQTNPIVVQVDRTRQFIRIEKQGTLDTQCRLIPAGYRGDVDEYESCYHPLELAEVEVIGIVAAPTNGALNRIATTTSGNVTPRPGGVGPAVQKTLTLVGSSTNPLVLSLIAPFKYDVQVVANHSTSSLIIENVFKKNGQEVRVGNIFSQLTVTTRRGDGAAAVTSVSGNTGIISGSNISVSSTEKFVFGFSGTKQANIPLGAYTIETTLSTVQGETVATKVTDFVVQ